MTRAILLAALALLACTPSRACLYDAARGRCVAESTGPAPERIDTEETSPAYQGDGYGTSGSGGGYVRGYYRSSGTYVRGYSRGGGGRR